MAFAVLELAYGSQPGSLTRLVDLASVDQGFALVEWRPKTYDLKDGGAWADSPFADGRIIKHSRRTNIVDELELAIVAPSQDAAISYMRDLRGALQRAEDFWTRKWGGDPVWLVAKSSEETNTRYALIYSGRVPEDGNPYAQPFLQPDCDSAVVDSVSLLIEHAGWVGEQRDAALHSTMSFDSRNFGTQSSAGVTQHLSSDGSVYVSNIEPLSNLTHIYNFDTAALPVWSGNLLDGAPPYYLYNENNGFPTPSGSVFFGISTAAARAGPFLGLVFDLIEESQGALSGSWSYWNGATWAAWPANTLWDHTASPTRPLSTLGISSVNWEPQANWATTNLFTQFGGTAPSVTAYWVRLTYAMDTVHQLPRQQNRHVYAPHMPWIGLRAAELPGDIPAKLEVRLQSRTGYYDIGIGRSHYNRFLVGSRSNSRGVTHFRSRLNAHSTWVGSNITFQTDTDIGGGSNRAAQTAAAHLGLPQAARTVYSHSGVDADWYGTPICRWTINATASDEFVGQYRALLSCGVNSGDLWTLGNLQLLLGVNLDSWLISQTKPISFQLPGRGTVSVYNRTNLIDLGTIEVPRLHDDGIGAFSFDLYAKNNDLSAQDLNIWSLVIIPVDEWFMSSLGPGDVAQENIGDHETYYQYHGFRQQQRGTFAELHDEANDEPLSPWIVKLARINALLPNVDQRLYFAMDAFWPRISVNKSWLTYHDSVAGGDAATSWIALDVQPAYFSMRGDS